LCRFVTTRQKSLQSGRRQPYSLRSEEEFVFVLKREIRIIAEETVFDLREGDAMAFDPQRPVRDDPAAAVRAASYRFVPM
jgi:hypothetical protein